VLPTGCSSTELEGLLRAAAAESSARVGDARALGGSGTALGLPATWLLSWSCLSHEERVNVPQAALSLRTVLDTGRQRGWQTDLSSLKRNLLPGDDAWDRAVLATAVRTGAWAQAALDGALQAEADGELLVLRLPGSVAAARLELAGNVPARLTLQLHSGGEESWTWKNDWPLNATHADAAGQATHFRGELMKQAPVDGAEPPLAPTPSFAPASMPVGRCAGGQLTLRCLLAGSDTEASWVLDPCCDGAVVTPAAADAARMPSMGRMQQLSVGGAVAGPLRMGSLQLGGLRLPDTSLYTQMSLDGVLLGGAAAGEQPAGVVGLGALLRCRLSLRLPKREPGARSPPANTAELSSLAEVAADPPRLAASWQAVTWLDGLPHIRATLRVGSGAASFEGLFRLALGVGGCGLILARDTAAQLGFVNATVALTPSGHVTGMGETRGRLSPLEVSAVASGRVDELELRGASWKTVRCLVHEQDDPADLQLSKRAAGLLCSDLFRGVTLHLDLANGRVAAVPLDAPAGA